MQYFFILGNNPTLSLTEISAVFNLDKNQGQLATQDAFILETEEKIEPTKLIKKMGGTIKIGLIAGKADFDNQAVIKQIKDLIDKKEKTGKFKFGLSYCGQKKINLKPIGMEIKKYLKEKNISCRWVTSKEKNLSSVVVEQNKLTSRGLEIVLIPEGSKILIGETLAVQPFKDLSFRDYGRPARNDYSGMLPPKLAQIMINLALPHPPNSPLLPRRGIGSACAGGEEVILDPFCGSGTILTEALLMGYKNLIGSDISPKAVEDTEKNIQWLNTKYPACAEASAGRQILNTPPAPRLRRAGKYKIYNQKATELSLVIKPNTIDAIITEPYLGPPRGKIDIKKIAHELEQLYAKSLSEFSKILKPDGRIVMIWPVFNIRNGQHCLSPDLSNLKIIEPLPMHLSKSKNLKLTPRKTIIYGRPGQKVWREIIILKK